MNIKKSFLILCLSLCFGLGYAQRTVTNFNNDWQFILEDHSDYSKENFNDSLWKNLNVPHDWSFEKGVRKGGDQGQGGGYHDGGIGWYRKQFNKKKKAFQK
ncbi:hypothetical protein [Olleya sp. R77988]|uniref:hypothetical protein n=1 Tax=Olleya sp. R77988 TaxID=3093875 RepID=UPI0037C8B02C